jgi:hypothetical protein
LVKLDGVEQPVRLFERLGVVGDIVVAGIGTSRRPALVIPSALINVVSAKSSVDDLDMLAWCMS